MTEIGTLWFLAAVAQLCREVYDVNLQPAGNIFDSRLNKRLWLLIAVWYSSYASFVSVEVNIGKTYGDNADEYRSIMRCILGSILTLNSCPVFLRA